MKRTGSKEQLSLTLVRLSSTNGGVILMRHRYTWLWLIICGSRDDINSQHKYLQTTISCDILIIVLIIVYRTNHRALQSRIQSSER